MPEHMVRLDYGFCTQEGLKGNAAGINRDILEARSERLAKVHAQMAKDRKDSKLGFFELPFVSDDVLDRILEEADRLRSFCDTLVVLGIGGSALGATAVDMGLAGRLRHAFQREVGSMRLFVADSPDPLYFGRLLENLDLKRTAFNVISKSGSTAETMSQFMVVKDLLEMALGPKEALKHLVFTTDPEKGNLRLLAGREPINVLEVPPNVGGRYSVLSAVGLLPLACAGHDIRALLAGAAKMAHRCMEPEVMQNPAYMFAELCVHFMHLGRNILVMMPYASDLFGLAQWFAQLWAESLGKAQSLSGETVNVGQTPVAAVGPTDQHSQLQLYMEGPMDKLVCFLTLDDYQNELIIPPGFEDIDALSYLGGKTLAQLTQAEAKASAAALASQGRPSLNIRLPKLDEHCLGQVIMLLEAATVAAGGLLKINPLDQPGVELGKTLTYGLMGRKGFEEQAEEMNSADMSGRFIV